MKLKIFIYPLLFLFLFYSYQAQQTVDKEFTAMKIDTPPTIDGVLDEAIWQKAQVLTDFAQYFPSDSEIAEHQTYIQAAYTDTHLYISIKAENPDNNFVASTLKRDFLERKTIT